MTTSNEQSPNYLSPRPGNEQMVAAGASPVIELNPAPAEEEPSSGRSVSLAQLLRYRWSILFVGLLGSAIGCLGVWASLTPRYSATATIKVAPVLQSLTGESDKIDLYESYRRSLTDALIEQRVLERVIEHPDVQKTDWYRNVPETKIEQLMEHFGLRQSEPPIDRLRTSLRADAPSGKQLITVGLSTGTPGESRTIVDTVTTEFVALEEQRASDSEIDRMDQLQRQIDNRETLRNQLEAQAASIRSRVTGDPESLVEQRLLRLDELESRLLALNSRISALGAATADAPDGEAALTQSYENDPRWQKLNNELEAAKAALANAPDRFAAAHPLIKNLQQRVDYASKHLDERVAELTKWAAERDADGQPVLDPEIQKLGYERDALTELVARERNTFDSTFADAEELKSINDKLEKQIEPLLIKLKSEREKLVLNREVPGRILALNAYEPAAPTEDKRVKLGAAAIFGSFALAFGMAFIRLQLNKRVEDLGDVSPRAREAVLGYLPLQHGPKSPLDSCPIHAESVRMVRTALLHQIQQHGSRILQISSANSGAGKTTLAILLSRSLAQVGQRVLLVDTDIRRPAIARRLKINSQPGLMDILLKGAPASDCTQQIGDPPVDVVTRGADTNGNQVDALANGSFKHQLEEWRSLYDVVILDGPPMLGIADGAILARHADATIFVTRERHCRRDELEGAVNLLSTAGGRLLGFVFIGSSGSLAKYGYAYGYGYNYAKSVYATATDQASDSTN